MSDTSTYPVPEWNPEWYIDFNVCPICKEFLIQDIIPHPNYPQMNIHRICWLFIRNHWVCRKCREYMNPSDEKVHIIERGDWCRPCATKYFEAQRNRVI